MSGGLSDRQLLVLTGLANYQGTATPQNLAHEVNLLSLSWYGRALDLPWQSITRTMASLVARRLATRHHFPKQTWYEITDAGREACTVDGQRGGARKPTEPGPPVRPRCGHTLHSCHVARCFRVLYLAKGLRGWAR